MNTAPASLRVYLFGAIRLEERGDALNPPPSAAARSLLAYLVLNHDQAIPRNRLVGLFWPDQSEARARHSLSNALWQIRRALGPAAHCLAVGTQTVAFQFSGDAWLDVKEFQGLCAADLSTDRLRRAVELYRADFLEDVYDDWALLERERLREMYLDALEELITLLKQQDQYEQALGYAQRLAAADPLREAAHRELMRLYHLLGRSHEALKQFATLRDLLEKEMGLPPSRATAALHREIAAALDETGPAHLPAPPSPPPLLRDLAHLPFVGRADERGVLLHALQTAAQGSGRLVLVEGDAGVGKSRLVGEAMADARWRGFQVGLGKADPLLVSTPYHLWRDALAPLLTPLRIAQLGELLEPVWLSAILQLFPTMTEHLPALPVLPSLDPREEQRRLWEGLARCLNGLSSVAPLLLVVEDLHWADEASLAALPHLAPYVSAGRLFLILTCRTAEAHERVIIQETLEALDRAMPLLRLHLRTFGRAEAVAMVQRALGVGQADEQATAFAQRLQGETEGNALFMVETLKSLLEQGTLARVSGEGWRLPADDLPLPTPASIQELVSARVARQSPELRAVLEWVAVLGEEADFPILARLGEASPAELAGRLGQLCRRGFLAETTTHYRFEHDLVRDIVYRAIAPDCRRTLHRQIGETLERLRPEWLESLAYHFSLGEAWDRAIYYHGRAGEQAAAMHAYPAALRHYDQAISLAAAADLPARLRFDLLATREATLNILGQREQQAADLKAMEQMAQGAGDLALVYQRRAWLLLQTSRFAEAEAAARQALALAEQLGDRTRQAAALTALGTAIHQRGDMLQAVPVLESAIALYGQLGDLDGEAKACRAIAGAFHGTGAYPAAHQAVTAALTRYEALGDQVGQAEGLDQLGALYMEQGETDKAMTCYRQALEICSAIGYRYEQAKILTNQGNIYYFEGQLASALRCYDEAIVIFTSIGERRGEAFVRANAATVRHTTLGDDEAAACDAEAALALYAQAGDRAGEGQCLDTLGGIALRRGDLALARRQWEAALAAMQAAGDRWGEISVRRSLVGLALGEGHPPSAWPHLESALALCQELDLADRITALHADRGAILLAQGQPEAALSATTQAMAGLRPGVEQAYLVPFVHYRALARLGRDREAGAAIQQAHRLLSEALQDLSPEQQKMSLEQVPEHRAIVAAWESSQARPKAVRLARAGAPAGRPLREDEFVEVTWTVTAPGDDELSGEAARRRRRLDRLLREAAEQSAAPTVTDLAQALGVTERTIKRDLATLRAAGHPVPTRGSRRPRR